MPRALPKNHSAAPSRRCFVQGPAQRPFGIAAPCSGSTRCLHSPSASYPAHTASPSIKQPLVSSGPQRPPAASAPASVSEPARASRDCSCGSSTSAAQTGSDVTSPATPSGRHAFASSVGRHSLLDAQGRMMLKNLTQPELEQWCVSIGENARRGTHIWRWMYAGRCFLAWGAVTTPST